MLQIMVYNSDLEKAQLLCRVIAAYFQKVRHSYKINAFTKSEDALKHIRASASGDDIAFFDCRDLQKAALLIRQFRENNSAASWVYIGPDLEALCRILLMRPSAYLADASDASRLLAVVRQLELYHQEQHKKYDFSFKCDGDIVRVPYAQISYFESSAKKVTLHICNSSRTYHFSAKLDDIAQAVPGFFLRCHQSYLVNLNTVRNLDSKSHVFVLHSAEEIFISRRSYAAAKEAYENFLQSERDYPALMPR